MRVAFMPATNLREAQLENALLNEAQLEWANFWKANMKNVSLKQAQLTGANFQLANLTKGNFSWARIERSNFRQATLQGADFSYAHLDGSLLTGTPKKKRHSECEKPDVAECDILMKLMGTNFKGSSNNAIALKLVDLTGAIGIDQAWLNRTFGDDSVVLGDGLVKPCHWAKGNLPLNNGDPNSSFAKNWRSWVEANEMAWPTPERFNFWKSAKKEKGFPPQECTLIKDMK